MSEIPGANYKKVLPFDGRARYERILEPEEFIEKFVKYLHFLYIDKPETKAAMLAHYSDDVLTEIQNKHQYTDVDMRDAFKSGR